MDIKRFGQRERKHSKVQFPLIKEENVSQSGIQRLIAKFPQVLTDVSNLKTIKTKPAERLPKNINMPRKQTTTQRSVHQFLLAKRRSSKRIKRRSRVEMQHSARESSPEPIPTIPVGPQPAEASTDTCTTCIPAERLPVPVPALSPLEFTEEEIKKDRATKRAANCFSKKRYTGKRYVRRNRKALIRFRAIVRSVWHIIRLSAITSRHLKEMEEKLEFEVKDQGKVLCFDFLSFKSATTSVNGLSSRAKEAIGKAPKNRSESDIQCLVEIIDRIPMFSEYTQFVRHSIAAIIHYDELDTGRVVVKQGHCGTQIYFVVSGRLKCYMTESDPQTGRYKVNYLKDFTVGTQFGSVLPRELTRRDVTLVCKEPSELLTICKFDVLRLLEEDEERQHNQYYKFMKTMPYFQTWTDEQIQECANDSLYHAFEDKAVIIKEYEKHRNRLHIIENGKCLIVKRLDIVNLTSPYQSQQYLLPEIKSEKFLNKPYGKSLRIFKRESHFLQLHTLGDGDYFNAGEKMDNTSVIAKGKCHCLLVNRNHFEINMKQIELCEFAEDRDYLIPNRKKLYSLFITIKKWEKFKEQLVLEIKRKKNIPSSTTVEDVPSVYRECYQPIYTEDLKPSLLTTDNCSETTVGE